MAEEKLKFVEFDSWCPKCQHFGKREDEDPCYDCLTIPARENSTKPEYYTVKE